MSTFRDHIPVAPEKLVGTELALVDKHYNNDNYVEMLSAFDERRIIAETAIKDETGSLNSYSTSIVDCFVPLTTNNSTLTPTTVVGKATNPYTDQIVDVAISMHKRKNPLSSNEKMYIEVVDLHTGETIYSRSVWTNYEVGVLPQVIYYEKPSDTFSSGVMFFGGVKNEGALNTYNFYNSTNVYTFDLNTFTFNQVSSPPPSMDPRTLAAGRYYVEDNDVKIVVFGGLTETTVSVGDDVYPRAVSLPDIWVYSFTEDTWTKRTNSPYSHMGSISNIIDEDGDKVFYVLYGGGSKNTTFATNTPLDALPEHNFNKLGKYNITTDTWSIVDSCDYNFVFTSYTSDFINSEGDLCLLFTGDIVQDTSPRYINRSFYSYIWEIYENYSINTDTIFFYLVYNTKKKKWYSTSIPIKISSLIPSTDIDYRKNTISTGDSLIYTHSDSGSDRKYVLHTKMFPDDGMVAFYRIPLTVIDYLTRFKLIGNVKIPEELL